MRRSIAILFVSVLVAGCTLMPPDGERVRARQMEEAVLPMARTALQSGQVETARRLYLRLLDVDPESVSARMGLGDVSLQERETAVAARWYLSAVTRAEVPERRHAALLAHGRAALTDGQVEAAGESFARLIEPEENASTSNVAWGHNGVGLTLLLEGDLRGAVASLERAVLLAPGEERFEGNLNRALGMLAEYRLPEPVETQETPWQGGERQPTLPANVAPAQGSDFPTGLSAERADVEIVGGGESGKLTPERATEEDSAATSPRSGEPPLRGVTFTLQAEEPEPAERSALADGPRVEPGIESAPAPDATEEVVAEDMGDEAGRADSVGSEPYGEAPEAVDAEDKNDGHAPPAVTSWTDRSGADAPADAVDRVADSDGEDEFELRSDTGDEGSVAGALEKLAAVEPVESAGSPSTASNEPLHEDLSARPPVLIVTEDRGRFLQFGAYADRSNAEAAAAPLDSLEQWPVEITDTLDASDVPLYRVRMGPILTSEALQERISALVTLGYSVANPPREPAAGGVPGDAPYSALPTWLVEEGGERYLQAGAYRNRATAETLAIELRTLTDRPVRISEVELETGPPLHRVRIGPLVPDDPVIERFHPSQ